VFGPVSVCVSTRLCVCMCLDVCVCLYVYVSARACVLAIAFTFMRIRIHVYRVLNQSIKAIILRSSEPHSTGTRVIRKERPYIPAPTAAPPRSPALSWAAANHAPLRHEVTQAFGGLWLDMMPRHHTQEPENALLLLFSNLLLY